MCGTFDVDAGDACLFLRLLVPPAGNIAVTCVSLREVVHVDAIRHLAVRLHGTPL